MELRNNLLLSAIYTHTHIHRVCRPTVNKIHVSYSKAICRACYMSQIMISSNVSILKRIWKKQTALRFNNGVSSIEGFLSVPASFPLSAEAPKHLVSCITFLSACVFSQCTSSPTTNTPPDQMRNVRPSLVPRSLPEFFCKGYLNS